ncbi:MAG TPA: prolyl oligopeptidase family serine peptidase [Actinomycetes bacterium]|nr:prolyl oligopeptidase family serine peptidase [Actinomycetes bacterium]
MPETPASSESFPRLNARTGRFTRGAPRSLHLDRSGQRLLFIRSANGTDPVGSLWSLDTATGRETLVADPRVLLQDAGEELSPAERARRERSRESSAGIVGYATDTGARVAAFALSSRLWLADLQAPSVREIPAVGAVIDPRPDPTGTWVAYAADGGLHLVGVDGEGARTLAAAEGPDVTWGVAEFVAAEEMQRYRGYWWSPDGATLLAARVDEAPVQHWYVADPAHPEAPPVTLDYPVAGSANADVTVHLLGLDGSRTEVRWDRTAFPYLVSASWSAAGALLHVMSRDQRRARTLTVDPLTGTTTTWAEDEDEIWLDVVTGVPALLPDGRLVSTAHLDDTRRLTIDGAPVTPPSVHVSHVVSVDDHGVLVAGTDDPTESHLWLVTPDGDVRRLTEPGAHHTGLMAGETLVLATRRLDAPGAAVTVRREGGEPLTVTSYAEKPPFRADVRLMRVGEHDLCVGLLLPRDHVPGTPLPVLMDPYGGPHHQEVLAVHDVWLEPQWWADQGFAVVVADGRGTGARGREWDRAIRDEPAAVTLDDQVEALHAVAQEVPDLDLSRVAIRGWSYGGYLSALAVLRRPDVFHAAVAGAPVTDWRLYDTFYTERYLGHPDEAPEVYARNSLLEDAAKLERPLLLIHGLADDNVVAAHTLRLSSALLTSGRPHDVLPLSGVTHMTPQEDVAQNLLLFQLDWLRRSLPR